MALLDGASKYGRTNWRAVGVRASIYYDACRRHLDKWFEAADLDSDSGLYHLAHALACLAIIVDARAAGKLNDDRMYPGGFEDLLAELTPMVEVIKKKYADRDPHHYTVQDAPCACDGVRAICSRCPSERIDAFRAAQETKVVPFRGKDMVFERNPGPSRIQMVPPTGDMVRLCDGCVTQHDCGRHRMCLSTGDSL